MKWEIKNNKMYVCDYLWEQEIFFLILKKVISKPWVYLRVKKWVHTKKMKDKQQLPTEEWRDVGSRKERKREREIKERQRKAHGWGKWHTYFKFIIIHSTIITLSLFMIHLF